MTPLYLQNLALTSPAGGGRSVGMVRSRTKATELGVYYILYNTEYCVKFIVIKMEYMGNILIGCFIHSKFVKYKDKMPNIKSATEGADT